MKACTLEKGKAKGHGVHGIVSDQGWSWGWQRKREREGVFYVSVSFGLSPTLSIFIEEKEDLIVFFVILITEDFSSVSFFCLFTIFLGRE